MCELLNPYVPEIKDNAVATVRVVFRYTLANASKKVYCHVDGCSGAGIVYLTLPDDCAGGTSIFRHKPPMMCRSRKLQKVPPADSPWA